MSYRKEPFVVSQIYHIFNRSIARQPIFLGNSYYQRAMEVMEFYSYTNPPLRFSHYNRLPLKSKLDFMNELKKKHQGQIEMFAFCLMPNHVHFLIREIIENGIRIFMSNLQNSYAKYFNLRTKRDGSLFKTMFKGVRIETDEQFLHVARYIHINPLTAYILKNISQLEEYEWSSYPVYLNKSKSDIINTNTLLSFFPSTEKFIDFAKDQINYQRELDKIKHLLLE
ncbi:MAG: hypothetical protein A3H79_04370 [Candidatus Levybacteria bacterium RIFCSPLOWO2_02_FULL_36_8b]|nr:MAG: hypothetical protein A3H79_04370 [Candidatus Levybacteria bacterium RIFCSPLOWO2_02_FULL_36_8b]